MYKQKKPNKEENIIIPVLILVSMMYVFIALIILGSIIFWLFSEALFEKPPEDDTVNEFLIQEPLLYTPIESANESFLVAQDFVENNWRNNAKFMVLDIYYDDFDKTINESATFRYKFCANRQSNNLSAGTIEITVDNSNDTIENAVAEYTTFLSYKYDALIIDDLDNVVNYTYDKWLIDLKEKNLTVNDCKKLIINISNYNECTVRTFTHEVTTYGYSGGSYYYDIKIDYTDLDIRPKE